MKEFLEEDEAYEDLSEALGFRRREKILQEFAKRKVEDENEKWSAVYIPFHFLSLQMAAKP